MNIEAMAARMSLLTRALPKRILIVGASTPEAAALADRFVASGFEVVRADDGERALRWLDRRWAGLIVTSLELPAMDGLEFTAALRARGIEDAYVIMLASKAADFDHERAYRAGVDDFIAPQISDAELLARSHAAFNTISLRRSLKETQAALAHAPIDPASGAFSAQETLQRLQSELRRAQRYGRMLSVLTIGVRAAEGGPPPPHALQTVVQSIQRTIRAQVDWVGRVDDPDDVVLAVVLVEAAPGDGSTIKERLRKVLAGIVCSPMLELDFGLVGLEHGGAAGREVSAEELLSVATQCRLCAGRAGPAQLNAVQRSVAVGATIACRHGYALESCCTLKVDAATQRTR